MTGLLRHSSLADLAHRPYPLPRRPWVMAMKWYDYTSQRTHADASPASLSIRFRPTPAGQPQAPTSLTHFLTERYCLYTQDTRQRVLCGEIHHRPWPLESGEAKIRKLQMTSDLGIDLVDPPACVHFARQLDVVAWWNVAATAGRT